MILQSLRSYFFIFIATIFIYTNPVWAAPTLIVSAQTITPNAPITVTLKNGYGYANDWIGLYKVGTNDRSFISRVYIPKGQTNFTWSSSIATEGYFEFRLFLKDTYTKAATSSIIVSSAPKAAPPTLTLSKAIIDNLETYYQAPKTPIGVVYFFHGSGGSAVSFSQQVEGIYFASSALARGYYVVFLESANRQNKSWDPSGALSANKDLLHIQNVRNFLRNSIPNFSKLPEYAVGMSNGGGFAPFASYYFQFHAVAVYCASGYTTLFEQADYKIPVFYVAAENDSLVSNSATQANANLLKSKNIPVQYEINYEDALKADRFTRISGISLAQSNKIFSNLISSGYINSSGQFLKSPASVSMDEMGIEFYLVAPAIKDQLLAVYAEHQFTSEFSTQTLDFFSKY